jgi:hypothetical protein
MRSLHRITRLISVVSLTTLVVAAVPGIASAQQSPSPAIGASPAAGSLATADDAVRAYLSSVAGADLDAVLAASAVDQASQGFDLHRYVDRMHAFDPFNAPGPAQYPFYADINEAQLTARIAIQVRTFAYSLLSGQQFLGPLVVPADPAWADDFIAKVDPARLAGLTVEDVRPLDPDLTDDQRYIDNSNASAAMYGADEQVERLALLGFEGGEYELGFTLLRYGDTWGVISQTSALAGTDALGSASPTTREAYDAQTGH